MDAYLIKRNSIRKLLIILSFTVILSCTDDKNSENVENITQCLVGYDWCQPNCNNPTMAWKFSNDGTFNYSTTMFRGMSAWGKWKEIENNQIEISYTKTTENILPENKILNMPNCNTLKIGEITYKK